MKRVRTKSSDIAGNMDPPKRNKEGSPKGRDSPGSPKEKFIDGSDKENTQFYLRIVSHGRANGPLNDPEDGEEMLKFSVRDVPNPPAKLRKNYTGLSPRMRKEIFSDKIARNKYDTIVTEMEKMMQSMETAVAYDDAHKDEVDEPAATTLIISIQCEEGKHRSVSYAEELGQSAKRKDWAISIEHRDLGVGQADGGLDEDDSEEPTSPINGKPKESIKIRKKKDKHLKKARNQRLQVEIADSGAEDGFH
ncbi:hypothetical protein H2198_004880 [Neophaeococcomyces mojaviensis]|uniref:Uncharacterized protein n=1 Tax=Neophaeococcomyces mojaviensis TaxID=3383035 RepID=A0ACC3A7B9_9EURO|nr:hypothetical protein H2198_004880 [Knufia sp. JES_112]